MSLNSRTYGPKQVRDLSESLGKVAGCFPSTNLVTYIPLKPLSSPEAGCTSNVHRDWGLYPLATQHGSCFLVGSVSTRLNKLLTAVKDICITKVSNERKTYNNGT